MKRKKKTALIVLVAVVCCIAAAIAYLMKNTDDPDAEEEIYALNYKRENLQTVTTYNESGGYTFIADESTETGFYCKEVEGLPQQKACYYSALDSFIQLKAAYKYDTNEYEKYGLTTSDARADVTLKDGTQYTVTVGGDAPTENYCYYSVSTIPNTVFVTRKSQFMYYREDTYCFVSRLLAPLSDSGYSDNVESDLADRFTFTNREGESFTLVRFDSVYKDGAGNSYLYRQTAPIEGLVTATTVQTDFYRLMQFCASSALVNKPTQQQLKEYGLDKPDTMISIGYKDTDAVIYLKQAPDGNYYAYKEGVDAIWLVAEQLVVWLDIQPRQLLSSYVLSPAMADTAQLRIDAYGESFIFEIGDTAIECNGKVVDEQLFAKLYKLACSVNSSSPAGTESNKKVCTISFTLKSGEIKKVELYDLGSRVFSIALNGEKLGITIRESYAETLLEACRATVKGEEYSVLW